VQHRPVHHDCHPKVADLCIIVRGEEDVRGLDIPVKEPALMTQFKPLQHPPREMDRHVLARYRWARVPLAPCPLGEGCLDVWHIDRDISVAYVQGVVALQAGEQRGFTPRIRVRILR
jgi:hypothetical protein